MRRETLSATVALLCVALASAAPPELKLTAVKSKSGKVYTVTADAPGAKSVKLKLIGDAEVLPGPNDRVSHVIPTGPVTIIGVAASDTGELSEFATVSLDGGQPVPTPGPGPQPDPKPNPASPVKFIVIVEETADGVAGRGAFFADPALAARRKDKGISFRVVDKDVVGPDGKTPADVARFLTASSGKGYPQAFLLDGAGKVLVQVNLPKTPAELLTLLGQYGG